MDNTEEISKKVKRILSNKNWKVRRLIKAFPSVKFIDVSFKKKLKKIKKEFEKNINKVKLKKDKKINKIKNKYKNI